MIYDSIIIGSGIAGASAAMNLKIRNKTFLLFGPPSFNAKAVKAEQIQNYPAFLNCNGKQLSQAVFDHLHSMDIHTIDRKVNSVFRYNDLWHVTCGSQLDTPDASTSSLQSPTVYDARSIILAIGVEFSNPLDGEQALVGRGVSYCATCDGMLYRDRSIAVIATTADADKELLFLTEIAAHVAYIPTYTFDNHFDHIKNLTVYRDRPVAILGKNAVSGVRLHSNREIPAEGVFILKDAISPTHLVYGLQTDGRHIIVDRNMATNLDGCFACGDCTGRPYQYIKAAGEGNVAAHSVIDYLK